jgi:deoxyribose-phosphate aldolase
MNYASIIDHTLLKTDAQKAELTKLCQEAKQYKFASVCISPLWVKYAAEQLSGTEVAICTVIGFPQGATPTAVKVFETQNAIENGATEVDMVIPVGLLKCGEDAAVENDIRSVVNAAKGKALTKVIIETCLLTDDEKVRVCKLAVKAGADFVKTSTGFSTSGATVHDVALMRKTVGSHFGVKASGGVSSAKDAAAMVEAGATRIGTSHGIEIVKG